VEALSLGLSFSCHHVTFHRIEHLQWPATIRSVACFDYQPANLDPEAKYKSLLIVTRGWCPLKLMRWSSRTPHLYGPLPKPWEWS
jgi:hypothetical protein